jgi:hypothetical protein
MKALQVLSLKELPQLVYHSRILPQKRSIVSPEKGKLLSHPGFLSIGQNARPSQNSLHYVKIVDSQIEE